MKYVKALPGNHKKLNINNKKIFSKIMDNQ